MSPAEAALLLMLDNACQEAAAHLDRPLRCDEVEMIARAIAEWLAMPTHTLQ